MSAVGWRCFIHLERSCRIVFQPNKPSISAHFRHSSSLAWVRLFAVGGGGGIRKIIEVPTSCAIHGAPCQLVPAVNAVVSYVRVCWSEYFTLSAC